MGGIWYYLTVFIAFILLPILEQVLPMSDKNLSGEEESQKAASPFFDWLLYINVPVLFYLLWLFFGVVTSQPMAVWEVVGMTLSTGIVVGSIGINVAHELGHRQTGYEQFFSKLLLTTALYTHFFIEHNRGHHKWVATERDPATARLGESLYHFWLRSLSSSYRHAWHLEAQRLRQAGNSVFSFRNEMVWFQIAHVGWLALVGWFFGWQGVFFAVAVAVAGVLLLETVNYIEHYGLRRKLLPSGHYEKVEPWHSWNSDHEMGRIFLYELTRHSDHHYKSTRKYQVLRHFDESPQLPLGYPASMLLAMAPPLWFRVMNKRVEQVERGQ
jgi:alkane 1-monooxygenase